MTATLTTTAALTPSGILPDFAGRAFLAPMAGVSDPALRLLCRRMGAALVVTEFTSIHSIVANEERLRKRQREITDFVEYSEEERPVSVQLFGSETDVLARAARIVEPYFDVIDYNMGCPAPHITRQMAGGALLQEQNLTRDILNTLVESTERPVTLKMRAGVSEEDRRLFLEIAGIAEDAGVSMITLHPRTVSQGYSGRAEWDLIRDLKKESRIPIVGNGDIISPEMAKEMLDSTKCDYVMIGRGAMGNPMIFRQINEYLDTGRYAPSTLRERLGAFLEYMRLAARYNIRTANLRSQAMRFTRGVRGATQIRARLTLARETAEIEKIVRDAYAAS